MPTMIVRPVSTVWTRLLSLLLSLAVMAFAVAPAVATTIQTDLWIYAQGDTVNVSGDGFAVSEDVEIVTTDPYGVQVDRGTVLSDPYGNITYSFVLSSDVPGIYDVVASGLSSGLTASTQFDPAEATVTPSSMDYGSVAVGSSSAEVFTLQNTGTTGMNSISITMSGADASQFILNTSGTSTSLASGDTTTFAVSFTPTSIGAKSASATVVSNANPDPVISLSGVGTAADSTAPVITKTVTGTLGANGWYTSDVTVDWTVSDPESVPVLTGCVDVTYTAETTGVTSSCSATSAGGTSSDSATIKLDKTGPSASLAVTAGTLGSNGWYTSAVTVGTSGADAISDSVVCSPSQNFLSDTAGTTVDGSCINGAGLTTNAAPLVIKIDATGPTAVLSVTAGTAGLNGWYVTDVTVHTSGADDLGAATCTADQLQTAETTGHAFNGSCSDNAGNTTPAAPLTVKLDKTAPIISDDGPTPAAPNGLDDWYISAVSNAFSASDGVSGLDAACALAFPKAVSSGAAEGSAVTVASGSCSDQAGNTASSINSAAFKIDTTAPAVTVLPGRIPDHNGWYNHAVVFNTGGTDGISGLSDANCSADYTWTSAIDGDGTGLTKSGTCTDIAGNVGNSTSASFKFDDTNPYNVTFVDGGIVEGASYHFGFVPSQPSACTASDLMSGLDHCTVTPGGITVGAQQAVADAMDVAGNFAQSILHYTVLAWELRGFYQPVDMRTPANPNVINTVKGGSTVPLKFEIFAGATELTDVSDIKSFNASQITCGASGIADEIEITTTGGTSLRYDSTSGQFIQNWKTPTGQAGKCYVVTMTTQDGSSLSAYFKMK